MRPFIRKYWVSILAVFAILAASVVYTQTPWRGAREIASRPLLYSLGPLLDEIDKDIKNGRYGDAAMKYRQVLEIDPKQKERLSDVRADLVEAAETLRENGDEAAAVEIDRALDVKNEHREKKDGRTTSTKNADDAAWSWAPADLNDPNATPESILPPELPGYKITQNGWLKKPFQAGATYVPRSPAVAKTIDRVFLTVGKFPDMAGTDKLLTIEKQLFPVSPRSLNVNDHAADFSLYAEPNPELFPLLSSLYWKRGKWFFSLQVVPLIDGRTNTQASTEFKRGIALDVARKLGY